MIADRAQGTLNGIRACRNRGEDYILRLRTNCFTVYDGNGNRVDIAGGFARLRSEESCEAAMFAALPDKTRIPVRICVKRKDKEGCEKSGERPDRRTSRNGNRLQEKTVAFNELSVVVTSLPATVSAEEVLKHTAGDSRLRYISSG